MTLTPGWLLLLVTSVFISYVAAWRERPGIVTLAYVCSFVAVLGIFGYWS